MQTLPALMERSIRSSFSKPLRPILAGSLLFSALLIVALWLGANALIDWYLQGHVVWPWLNILLHGLAGALIIFAIMPIIMPAFIGFFVNHIAAIIEKHEYAGAEPGRDLPMLPELLLDLKFACYALFINIIILPLCLVPLLNLVLYYAVNMQLLGKQYYLMVGRRHKPVAELKAYYRANRRLLLPPGLLIALLSSFPPFNMFTPIFATSLMVHTYHNSPQAPRAKVLRLL